MARTLDQKPPMRQGPPGAPVLFGRRFGEMVQGYQQENSLFRRGEGVVFQGYDVLEAYGFAICQAPFRKPSPVVSPGFVSFAKV